MDEKSGYAMEDTFKGQSAHFEHAGARTPSSTEGGVQEGMIRRPARMYTPEEEKKLYRKVRLSLTFFPTLVSHFADTLFPDRSTERSCLFSLYFTSSHSWIDVSAFLISVAELSLTSLL